ncbi:MAG: hypothetical protein U0414_36230 [Polyangiaceae bacterium]
MTPARLAADARRQALMASLIALDHPAFPGVWAFRIHEGYLGMIIDTYGERGPSLRTLIHRGVRPKLEDILLWGAKIAAAMAVAHDAGLYHGMLEPKQILIDPVTEDPTILSLGVAQLRFDPGDLRGLDEMRRSGAPEPPLLPPKLSPTADIRGLHLLLLRICKAFGYRPPAGEQWPKGT